MVKQGATKTLAAHFYQLIRTDILMGVYKPGDKLAPGHIAARYEASTTVIREALLRLTSERLVENRPQRGFVVLALTLEELEDLTEVRILNDTFALAKSIERGDLDWETQVMSAHHVLSRTPRRTEDDPKRTHIAWTEKHRDFHLTLLAGAKIPVLLDLAATMFDLTELYRRRVTAIPEALKRDIVAEHAAITEATLARDTDLAVRLLAEHYARSMDIMREGYHEPVEDSRA